MIERALTAAIRNVPAGSEDDAGRSLQEAGAPAGAPGPVVPPLAVAVLSALVLVLVAGGATAAILLRRRSDGSPRQGTEGPDR